MPLIDFVRRRFDGRGVRDDERRARDSVAGGDGEAERRREAAQRRGVLGAVAAGSREVSYTRLATGSSGEQVVGNAAQSTPVDERDMSEGLQVAPRPEEVGP